MPLIEGTPNLPQDDQGHVFQGYMAPNGSFYAPRSDDQYSQKVSLWSPGGQPLLTQSTPGIVNQAGQNQILLDTQVTYAGLTSANVLVDVDVNLPAIPHDAALSYVALANPSATAFTVTVKNKETFSFDGSPEDLYPEVTTFVLPANIPNGKVYIFTGWLMGEGARLTFSNNDAIGAQSAILSLKVRRI